MRGVPSSRIRSAPCEAEETREGLLVREVAAGELTAFERLYRCYHPRLTRFLERVTHRPALVEELLDDTMLVVWRRAACYYGGSKVSTWIFAIAYRKALKALRRRDGVTAEEGDLACDEPGPEQHAGASERRKLLRQALCALTPEHRAVLELTYFQGLTCAEISQVLGCPVSTVKTRMFYARRRLRTLLAGLEDWP